MAEALLAEEEDVCPAMDPATSAENAGLIYVTDEQPGIRRRNAGRSFAYYDPKGALIRDETVLARIRSLAIPPAYQDVWICPNPDGHIQATGRDVKGRKQYRYHPKWHEIRDESKYGRLIEFAEKLPQIRARIDQDMGKRGLPREKVVATVIWLLDHTLIRVGNEQYSKANKSFGLTTLRNRHVETGTELLRFAFKGKSGKSWKLTVRDRRIARIVRSCQELPGQNLFQYWNGDGTPHPIGSDDVNDYIRDVIGAGFTAKHFRTWAGTVTAAQSLRSRGGFANQSEAKRKLNAAVDEVANRLVNTRAISRRCYIHPAVIESFLEGTLEEDLKGVGRARVPDQMEEDEARVLAFLKRRLEEQTAGEKS